MRTALLILPNFVLILVGLVLARRLYFRVESIELLRGGGTALLRLHDLFVQIADLALQVRVHQAVEFERDAFALSSRAT